MQYEAEVLPGLKSFATAELRSIPNVQVHQTSAEDAIVFEGSHQPEVFNQLRTVVAVYRVLHFAVPRPKALLGHQHFTALTAEIHRIRSANPSGAFSTFRISAAGSDSSVFRRLRAALAEHLHLTDSPDEADLLLRVRPALHRDGWEVLVRTTPRPLATRGYRLRDMRGALNATIAAVMVRQAGWAERVCNIACGTATLLIEWAAVYPGTQAIGVDTNREVLHMAAENAAAASVRPALIEADASALPFADRAFEVLLADLPWGQAVGTQAQIDDLYPAVLAQAARIAKLGARFMVITHAIDLFERSLPGSGWHLRHETRVYQGGLHPRIYHLEREA